MSVEKYRSKRRFDKTPEPAGAGKGHPQVVDGMVFVVHRHEARRLHYDLRIQRGRILTSWAVPRGFSYDPADKRLAVHTEDHPLEYEGFQGMIPKGEYGAGTMTIWDRGSYRLSGRQTLEESLQKGEVKIVFQGRRLRGEWHLVRTRGEEDQWLVFKAKDRFARSDPFPHVDLLPAPAAEFPTQVDIMKATDREDSFTHPEWLFEMGFDGLRMLIFMNEDSVVFRTAKGEEIGAEIPDVVSDLRKIRANRVVIDGVLVAMDEQDRPSRSRLDLLLRRESIGGVRYYAFDVLYYEEWDTRPLPLRERKALLYSILPRLPAVLYTDHVAGKGEELASAVSNAGLSSLIAKKAMSLYQPGESSSWLRISVKEKTGARELSFKKALSQSRVAQKGAAQRGTASGTSAKKAALKYTNLEKIYWPDKGITKGELLDYYTQAAGFIMPYLQDRPVHMYRFPDGIEGKAFYQKQVTDSVAARVEAVVVSHDEKGGPVRYMLCESEITLLNMVNLGSIDFHPWLSRRGSLDMPDWAVLDLDAKEVPFVNVLKIARAVGRLLRGIGLNPYVKTSGASGLHVFVPLLPRYSYEQSRMFCEAVARTIVREHGDIATVERPPAQRGGKVYVDFLQNRRGQTIVPPYAVRPVPGATVSTPLDWDELASDLEPAQFTMDRVLKRLADVGDLFRLTLTDLQDMLPAISQLESYLKT
jgi:bifunctional non-homologous end joining protein LigD